MIKAVAVVVGDLAQYAGRASTVNAANQGLIGENLSLAQVDDGLEGHAEVEAEGLVVAAGLATLPFDSVDLTIS